MQYSSAHQTSRLPDQIQGRTANHWSPLLRRLAPWVLLGACASEATAQCQYQVINQWSNGFTASIRITNNTATTINGWSINWRYSGSDRITNGWNATLSGTNPYSASHLSWNAIIAPRQTVEFGFQGTKGAANAEVPVINGSICTSTSPSSPPASSVRSTSSATASTATTSARSASSTLPASSRASSSLTPSSHSASSSSNVAITTRALIKLNQVGYKPGARKLAVVPTVAATSFRVINKNTSETVMNGTLSGTATWAPAQEAVKLADFSALTQAGTYELRVDGVESPAEFSISFNAYHALNAGAIKAFYFNRASIALQEVHAGSYRRAAGHMGDKVFIHASARSTLRPEGSVVAVTKGWYDAGDYNLYVVNSGISTYTLLAAYESFSSYFRNQNLNIPESADAVPDLLNEAMWNLEWMLAMQDPNDGGVYHKLTSKYFSSFVMPANDVSDRYLVQKTTAAALNFAATMATASRIYKNFENQYPGLAARMLTAARAAYTWAKANPRVYYVQPADISTGTYGDGDVTDEFAWAAAELYITTKTDSYYDEINLPGIAADVPWWGGVKTLGLFSLARNSANLTAIANRALVQSKLDSLAASIQSKGVGSAYGVALNATDFGWGSNSGILNQAWVLLAAYQLDTNKTAYLTTAQSLFDYVLGRNATDYSFVTGFGKKTPQNIHHRPSSADGVPGAIPGFLVGGANVGQEDKANCSKPYPSSLPAKSYLDEECSYASNEVAINWNAPLVYVSAALQTLVP
jgi:endoglucanase